MASSESSRTAATATGFALPAGVTSTVVAEDALAKLDAEMARLKDALSEGDSARQCRVLPPASPRRRPAPDGKSLSAWQAPCPSRAEPSRKP